MRRLEKDTVVEISEREFVEIASRRCANIVKMLQEATDTEEDREMSKLVAMTCAKFAAELSAIIFGGVDEDFDCDTDKEQL